MIRGVALFLALATVAAQALVLGAGLLRVAARRTRRLAALRAEVAPVALGLACAVAALATAGSLFFSEVAGFTPCRLCWAQRAAMYPLVALLGVTAWRDGRGRRRAAWLLTAGGGAVSAYHYLLEWFPALEGAACDPRAPCTVRWVWELGYVSIPMMALTAFALIAVLLAVARRPEGEGSGPR